MLCLAVHKKIIVVQFVRIVMPMMVHLIENIRNFKPFYAPLYI